MANEKEKKATQILMRNLVQDVSGRKRISWYNMTDDEWLILKQILEEMYPDDEPHRDTTTLGKVYETWKTAIAGANNAKRLELDQAALVPLNGLPTSVQGLKIWYNQARSNADPEWGDDPPPVAEQRWAEKLTRIVQEAEEASAIILQRWNDAEQIVREFANFTRLRIRYANDQTRIRLQTGNVTPEDVQRNIQIGTSHATEWIRLLNVYYEWKPTAAQKKDFKLYFTGQGFNMTDINWDNFKELVSTNSGTVCNLLLRPGGEPKGLDEYPEVNNALTRMSEILTFAAEMTARPVEARGRAEETYEQKARRIKDTLINEIREEYSSLVEDYSNPVTRKINDLEITPDQVKTKLRIVEGFVTTFEDLKKNDRNWKDIEKVRVTQFDREVDLNTFECIMTMLNRVQAREEVFKEEKKSKQIKETNQNKILEELVKPENRVVYKEPIDFLPWLVDNKIMLESLPPTIDDAMRMAYIRKTIGCKTTLKSMELCKNSNEMLQIMADKHVDDKGLINEIFKPVYKCKYPSTYTICYHNIEVVLRCLDTLKDVGVISRVQVADYDECVHKAIHPGREIPWTEKTVALEIGDPGVPDDPLNQTALEKAGTVDIQSMLKRRNTQQSVEDMINILHEYLKREIRIVQTYKDKELRIGSKTKNYYFFNQENEVNMFSGQFGNRGGFNRGNFRGGMNRGGLSQGGVRYPKPKYPLDKEAYKEALKRQKPGATKPPPIGDCPMKCEHSLPYSSVEYCDNFKKKDLSMRHDTVKKLGLCRQCLKVPRPHHHPKDCMAPRCNKCDGDHSSLICPKPKGTQIFSINSNDQEVNMYGDGDIFGEVKETQIHALSRDEPVGGSFDHGGYSSYGIMQDDYGNFDQGQEAMILSIQREMEEEGLVAADGAFGVTFFDPNEEKNSFKISMRDDSYEVESLGVIYNEYEAMGNEGSDPMLSLRPDYMTKGADAKHQNIYKVDRQLNKSTALSGGLAEKETISSELMGKTENSSKTDLINDQNSLGGDMSSEPDDLVCRVQEYAGTVSTPQGEENTCGDKIVKNQLTDAMVTRDSKVTADLQPSQETKLGQPKSAKSGSTNSQKTFPVHLTWMQRMWAKVPQDQKDWVKNFHTQERPWGSGDKLTWKKITMDAGIDESKAAYIEKVDPTSVVSQPTDFSEALVESTVFNRPENNSSLPFEIKQNKYVRYKDSKDYQILRKAADLTPADRYLFDRMVQAGINLKKLFKGVRGMTSKVNVRAKVKNLPKDIEWIDDDLVRTTALFDGGSDMGCHTEHLAYCLEMKELEPEYTSLTTANGYNERLYQKKAIKLVGEIASDNVELVHTFESIEVPRIGNEKKHMKTYVNIVAALTGMSDSIRKHLIEQCDDNEDPINMILGQRDGGMLMTEIFPEQLGITQHHLLPNIVIYQNPLTKNLILAGDMGINEELVDPDFPVLYVHKKKWKEIQDAYKNCHEGLLRTLLGEDLNVSEIIKMNQRDREAQMHLLEARLSKSDIEEVDKYLDEITAEKQQVEHKLKDKDACFYMEMSGIRKELGDTYMDDESDEYILNEKEFDDAAKYVDLEEKDENMIGFTNLDSENLKKFIEAESISQPELKCESCRKRECHECEMLRDKFSAEDRKIYKKLWENTRLVNKDGKQRVEVEYIYRNDPHETFKKENSNMKEAKARTDGLIRKLKATNSLDDFKKEIQKKVDTGTLVKLTKEEEEEILNGTHHFTYLSMVKSETSTSTSTRLINDTLTSTKMGSSYSLENKVPTSEIGDSYGSLIDFKLYPHGYSSDISKCYLRVLVDQLTARLRLCYWYEDPENFKSPIIYKRNTMDFGDSIASLVIRIIQLKFLIPATNLKSVRDVIRKGAYADNYSSSYRTEKEFFEVKKEMEKIHAEIGLPLKATYTDVSTDPEMEERIKNGEEDTYTFLGIRWNLLKNTILPNIYFNLAKKHKGTSGDKKIMDMEPEDFGTRSFVWGMTRRTISRLCAQTYSRLGVMLGPVVMAMKICVSRSCEVMGPTELDVPIATKDANFAKTVAKVCQELPKLKDLKPFPKEVVPKGAELTAFAGWRDGGAPGYAGNWYACSKKGNEDFCNMLTNKSKVSKRPVPTHEALSAPLHMDMLKEAIKAIEHREEIANREIKIYAIGDSVCTACLFNPDVDIRNVLIRGAVWATKQRCREILEIFPKATIYMTWMAGTKNTADYGSKLHTGLVRILNSDDYRHGVNGMLTIDGKDHVSFYQISKQEEKYYPLPQHLIEGARGKEKKLIDLDPTRSLSNNKLEQEEVNICSVCTDKESCGIYMTTRNTAKKMSLEDKIETKANNPKSNLPTSSSTLTSNHQWDKILKTNMVTPPKDIRIWENEKRIIRENGYYKAMSKSVGRNLFDPDRKYMMSNSPLEMRELINKTLRLDHMIGIGRYMAKWRCQQKGQISLEGSRKEIWRKMLITSQQEKPPQAQKTFRYEEMHGVTVIVLRIPSDKARDIWGTRVLPVLDGSTVLAGKIIREAHERVTHGFGTIHQGLEATIAEIQSGEKGVFIPQVRKHVGHYILTCKVCNEQRNWTYSSELEEKYTKNTVNGVPFKKISIDMLGPMQAKTYPGSRTEYKVYPLLAKCLETGALWATLMEGAGTKEVVKALIKLEVMYGEITSISRDAGSNLHEENINPLVAINEGELPKRLLGVITHYVAPPDGQHRNYTERSTKMFKKMMDNLAEAKKDVGFPALPKSSLDLIVMIATDACNKVPYGHTEGIYLCPADLIGCRSNEIRIEETSSKLIDLNNMMRGLTQYYRLVNNARNEILRNSLVDFAKKSIKEGKGKRDIRAKVGDLVLVRSTEHDKSGTYGVIKEMESNATALIKTKKGEIRRAVSQLIPLAGDCLADEKKM